MSKGKTRPLRPLDPCARLKRTAVAERVIRLLVEWTR